MGSRLKQNPERTFNWFFEATCPVVRDKDPGVQFQFPEDFSDEESCQTLPRFCFPYDTHKVRDVVAVQHFTFVLTDLEGRQRFGFCRLTNSTQTCLCILSYLPWFEVFYKLLNNLADYLSKGQTKEMKALLAALYKQPIPLAAGSVTLQMGEQLLVSTEVSQPGGHPEGQEAVPYFIAPDPRSLPSIPENRNLTELIVAVDVGNLLQLYASMLFERRILIFASKLSTLTSCVHALSAMLYPMYWQHIFIPVLPPHLLDYCCAPMPYLIGVHTSLSERVQSRGLEEVTILNVDTNTLETPFDDLKKIPSDVVSGLKLCLKRQAVSPGCGVSRAFLRAQSLLFGGYRDALQGHTEGGVQFSEELFLHHKSHSMRQFLQSAIHLQFFKQFIDDRLDILNTGKEPDDLFEEEILNCETLGRSKSYQQLVGNIKKGGGALILNMKSKANMRAKDLAKSGLKNLLMHKPHGEKPSLTRGGSVSHRRAQSDCLQNRLPITQHFGMSRPRRPARDKERTETGDGWDGADSGAVVDGDSEPQKDEDEGEESLLSDPEELDLLGEIFDTLSSRSFHDRGLLYGTRSLDLFGPDSHDYITKRGTANPSQESLSLSISGSGSLHSWNLENTEEASDPTEEPDWQSLVDGGGLQDEAVAVACDSAEPDEAQRTDVEEKQEDEKVVMHGNQQGGETDNGIDSKEVKLEEEKNREEPERGVNSREEETAQRQEDKGMRESVEGNQREETVEENDNHERTNKVQEDVAEEGKGVMEEEIKGCLGEGETTPGPQSPGADSTNPTDSEKCNEGPKNASPPETRPKVRSATACFRPPPPGHGFQVRLRNATGPVEPCAALRSRGSTQPSDSDSQSEESSCMEGGEDPPPVKVSELKKRFEA